MKTKQLLLNAILAFFILGLSSCLKEKDEAFEVQGDVYYINKTVNNEIVHSTIYYAYGNQRIESATVTTPVSSQTIDLAQSADFYNYFIKSPEEADYTTDIPETGKFDFEITSSLGEVIYCADEQTFENLPGAEIDSMEFDSNNFWLKIYWNEVEDCDGYFVKLLNQDGDIIFDGYSVAPDYTEFIISQYYSTGKWNENPVNNEEYTVTLQTFLYDDDATAENFAYSIREVTVKDTVVTWHFE